MTTTWQIGRLLNAVQSTFVGLLRVWSVPIVLLLSIASGYTTYYGLSYFITDWIALSITIAVQSIIVICTLELAGMHWRANPLRWLMVVVSLVVALVVSVSFSYFKFYEFSEKDTLLYKKGNVLRADVDRYLEQVVGLKSRIIAAGQRRIEQAAREANHAYLGDHPAMTGEYKNHVGRGPFWSHYKEILDSEKAKLKQVENRFPELDKRVTEVRESLADLALHLNDAATYERMLMAFQRAQSAAETLVSSQGMDVVPAPRLASYPEFARGVTPSFAMWEDVSLFALACAAMVDFFTLILSYRLEFTAPGPLAEEEKEFVFQGLRQFNEFTINQNDELEFVIEKTELERARRYSDWHRMFAVAFLLNRGYLRKMSSKSVEFAPNLYPVIAEQMRIRQQAHSMAVSANEDALARAMREHGEKRHG